MIGIVIPAHNEEGCLQRCLGSVLAATKQLGLEGERVNAMVMLDGRDDGTPAIVEALPSVGGATGTNRLVENGARWIACPDADAVCGVVEVGDWRMHSPDASRHYEGGRLRGLVEALA